MLAGRTSVVLPLVLALALAAAGCGKSEPQVTKAQYVARANAVCGDTSRRVKALQSSASAIPFAVLAREAVKIRQRANETLAEIPVPKGETVPKRWLRLREATLAKARAIFAARPGSAAYEAARHAYNKADSEVTGVALRYGLVDCVAPASN
jgi:hypothetical protein